MYNIFFMIVDLCIDCRNLFILNYVIVSLYRYYVIVYYWFICKEYLGSVQILEKIMIFLCYIDY